MANPPTVATCDACLARAPVRKVLFKQNIGAVVMHFQRSIDGHLCRNCVNRYFTQYSLVTLFLGWWGVKSMFLTPIFLLIDVFNWFGAWGLPKVPPGTPSLKTKELNRLRPLTQGMMLRLQEGVPLDVVTADAAKQALVTNDQVVRYLTVIMERTRSTPEAPQSG